MNKKYKVSEQYCIYIIYLKIPSSEVYSGDFENRTYKCHSSQFNNTNLLFIKKLIRKQMNYYYKTIIPAEDELYFILINFRDRKTYIW